MIEQTKIIIIGIIILIIFVSGWYIGDKHATEKYLPQITQLKDAIDIADKEAKQKQTEYQENANAIKNENDKRINDIHDYYKRLQSMPSQTGSSSPTSGSQTANGATSQSTITGCPASIEENCAIDATKVNMWQEWAVKNKIPVSVD